MPVSFSHRGKDLVDERHRNIFMKEITHGIHKNNPWFLPAEWSIQQARMQSYFKTIDVATITHCFEAVGHALGIAVETSRASL